MRIKAFSFLINEHLEPYQLENTEVVVDGQNIYYKLYEKSGIPFILGSECDKFANYVREYISILKEANLKCHIILKGGHDSEKYLDIHFKLKNKQVHGKHFVLGENDDNAIIQPCMAKEVFMQVLDEMGFDYTISHATDVPKECFELAQRLSCPVMSLNMQYSFSPVPYVPFKKDSKKLKFEKSNNLTCGIFKRQNFLQHYMISKEKLILFILLTDAHILKEDYFLDFFKACKIPPFSHIKRYKGLLKWLSRRSKAAALQEIFKYISESDRQTFLDNKTELELKFLNCVSEESVTSLYFTNRNSLKFDIPDQHWFEKGIALKYIAIPYINLYYWGIIVASRLVEDYDQENSLLFAKDILKYAYDLLKNFNGKNIYIKYRDGNNIKEISEVQFVRKPDYVAQRCVFENGWENIDSRGLFEHFFLEIYGSFDFAALESAPADVRLLLIALVYFKRNKKDDMTCEVYSIILSYVLLGVVAEKVSLEVGDYPDRIDIVSRPLLDSITQKDLVTIRDCIVAKAILEKYCIVSGELLCIFDRTKIHPLFQFEWCLLHINHLNNLCGSPYTSTVYRKTYNGTLVYKMLCKIKGGDAIQTITDLLSPAPSVLAFMSGIIELYKKILYEY